MTENHAAKSRNFAARRQRLGYLNNESLVENMPTEDQIAFLVAIYKTILMMWYWQRPACTSVRRLPRASIEMSKCPVDTAASCEEPSKRVQLAFDFLVFIQDHDVLEETDSFAILDARTAFWSWRS